MLVKAIVVALVAGLAFKIGQHAYELGVFRHGFQHHPGPCRQVPGLKFGAEDFRVLGDGLTFITSGLLIGLSSPQFREFLRNNDIKGRMYLVDLNLPQTKAVELTIKASESFNISTFRPHGIDVLEDKSGKGQHLLYVVNHVDGEEDHVEKFRYSPKSKELQHVRTFASDLLHITNDLALTGEDTFYISDYFYYKTPLMHIVENFLAPKMGSMLHFNGKEFSTVDSNLFGPNGVTISSDKSVLFVALPHTNSINVYKAGGDAALTLVQEVMTHTSVDNLHLSQDGRSLFAGCHHIGYKAMAHLLNPGSASRAPSQVLHMPLRKDGLIDEKAITETFYDHGDLISGSSVASIYNKKLLIGSVIDKLVVCDLP